MALTRILLWIMIGSLVMAALLGIATILLPTPWQMQSRILGTCLLVGGFSIPAFACAAMIRQRRLRFPMWSALVALAAALCLWMSLLWVGYSDWRVEDNVMRIAGVLSIIGGWGAHLAMMMMLRMQVPISVLVRRATLAVAGLLAAMGIFVILFEFNPSWFVRVLLVLIILGSCGTLVTPLLAVIEMIRMRSEQETVSPKARVQITCPRCGHAQQLRTGSDRCGQCNLRINISFEEPRCTCGYQLYKLHGDACPECGRAIPQAERWPALQQATAQQQAVVTASDESQPTR